MALMAFIAMAPAGLLNSFLAAIQASLSVLLVISYGAIAVHLKILSPASSKSVSKICVRMFLPALLLTRLGSEMHSGSASRYGIVLIWALLCHFVSFLIGIAAHLLLGMPDWITVAIMFNNTTSYPLLLIQSLDETGILKSLIVTDETTTQAIDRAKSYFLVFATVSSCLTFAVGPRLIDSEHTPDAPSPEDKDAGSETENEDDDDVEFGNGLEDDRSPGDLSPTEQDHLLPPPLLNQSRHDLRSNRRSTRASIVPTTFFPTKPRESITSAKSALNFDRRPSYVAKRRWNQLSDTSRWWLLFFYDFLNAPLVGALLGVLIGLVPALHRAFFSETQNGGIFSAWLTQSLKNIGMIFVPLPVVIAGVSLYTAMKQPKGDGESGTPWLTTLFILVIRFIVWPIVSIALIYGFALKTQILGDDPMLWFTMMLMPTGPPAMKLIAMVEISDANEEDEHKIAKLLTISYIISPILAFTVVGSLRASSAVIGA